MCVCVCLCAFVHAGVCVCVCGEVRAGVRARLLCCTLYVHFLFGVWRTIAVVRLTHKFFYLGWACNFFFFFFFWCFNHACGLVKRLTCFFFSFAQSLSSLSPDTFIPKDFNSTPSLSRDKKWHFVPLASVRVGEPIGPGDIFGTVQETPLFLHRVMIAPNMEGGVVTFLAAEGDYTITDVVLELSTSAHTRTLAHMDQDQPRQQQTTHKVTMLQRWPIRTPRPFQQKIQSNTPFITGLRSTDILFPCAEGGSIGISALKGCGKTGLAFSIFKYSKSDVIVYAGCGERDNDLYGSIADLSQISAEPVMPVSGATPHAFLADRAVVVAHTCSMPAGAREASLFTSVTIAEYFRDMGYNVLLTAETTTRWALALQERAAALGEMNVECGLPAQLSSRLRSFYARAGKCTLLGTTVAAQQRREGSVTIMGSASPGHPDGTGYEAAMLVTRDIVDVFWSLDLNLARRKHFPAISWSASTSNCVPALHAYFDQNDLDIRTLRTSIIDILKSADDLAGVIARVGKHMSQST